MAYVKWLLMMVILMPTFITPLRAKNSVTPCAKRHYYSDSMVLPRWGYFSSPVFKIYSSTMKLNKEWSVGTGGNVAQMGSWISPKGAGVTFITAMLFGDFNMKALEKNYSERLKTMILTANQRLPKKAGQLIRCTYFYNNENISDVKSVRFSVLGAGHTPEESYAEGPISQIDSKYTPGSAFPIQNEHFVWIYKTEAGDIEIETIRDPFVKSFKERGMKVREETFKSQKPSEIYDDKYLKEFRIAQSSIAKAKQYEKHLADKGLLAQINKLNENLEISQNKLNELIKQFNDAKNSGYRASSMLQFIDAISNLNEAFNSSGANVAKSSSSLYKEESNYLQEIINSLNEDIKVKRNEVLKFKDQLENIYRKANIPPKID